MNTYIINPMFFYWISVADSLKAFSTIACTFSAIALFVGVFKFAMDNWSAKEFPSISERERKAIPGDKKIIKYSAIAFVITGVITIFVPTKDTLICIEVAKLATVENAQLSIDAIKAAADYIVESIKSISAGG